jgi:hypothetical protein
MEYHVKCVGVNGFRNILFLSILSLCSNKYYNILVVSILITLFSKMLKFLEFFFFQIPKFCEGNQRIFVGILFFDLEFSILINYFPNMH